MTDRVLIVTPVFTHPPIQGNAARVRALGRQLKRHGFTVDVLHYALDSGPPEALSAMRAEWSLVETVEAKPHRRMTYPSCWGLDDWCPDQMVEAVRRLTVQTSYAAVIVNYVWMTRCFEGVEGGSLRILDTHDVFGDRHLLGRYYGINPNWFFTTAVEENRGFDRADLVIAIQDAEARSIALRTTSSVTTVGHPVPPAFLALTDSHFKVATFGYLGSANPWNQRAVANLDAAAVRQGGLDWAIGGTICGMGLPLESVRYVFGVVDRPEDLYRHVDCCLNPMESGTGLKIKTIEAIAYGRPVIGTRVAFEGLDARHAFHQIEDAEGIVAAASDYVRSEWVRAEVANASRRLYLGYMDGVRRQYADLAEMIRTGKLP
jgi:hypothetical protein